MGLHAITFVMENMHTLVGNGVCLIVFGMILYERWHFCILILGVSRALNRLISDKHLWVKARSRLFGSILLKKMIEIVLRAGCWLNGVVECGRNYIVNHTVQFSYMYILA